MKSLEPGREVVIIVDGSQTGTPYVIGHVDKETGLFRPAAFGGNNLTPAQKKWHVNDIELLAAVAALKHYEHVVRGSKVILVTDSTFVLNYKTVKDLSPRRSRMLSYISGFNISVRIEKSKFNPSDNGSIVFTI